jgi:hypothetical protein
MRFSFFLKKIEALHTIKRHAYSFYTDRGIGFCVFYGIICNQSYCKIQNMQYPLMNNVIYQNVKPFFAKQKANPNLANVATRAAFDMIVWWKSAERKNNVSQGCNKT